MWELLVLVLLVCVADFTASQQCSLVVEPKKELSFIQKLKIWFGFLKEEVEEAKTPDCKDCKSIRPAGQTTVPTERDSRVGCRCQATSVSDKVQCACCFKVWKWDYLICVAAGFFLNSEEVFVIATVEDHVVFKFNISLASQIADLMTKVLQCVPLPPPVEFISACFRPSIERPNSSNKHMWKICGKLKLGLFQIPIITLFMKCFEIKDSLDDMIIEGQTRHTIDVRDPARAVVSDEKSYNPVVCLSNTKKEEALNCSLSRKRRQAVKDSCDRPKPVEITHRINWEETKVGELPYLAVIHQRNYPVPVQHVTEDDKFPYIKATLERTEDEKWMNHSDKHTFKQPGRTCGGVLLSANKVLTICACVRSFYIVNKLHKEPGEDIIFPHDIQSVELFVDLPGVHYTAAEDYRLDRDGDKFMSNSLCAKRIESNDTWDLQTLMMVMPFTPDLKSSDRVPFVKWPPSNVKQGQSVRMIAIGMNTKNRSWTFRSTFPGKREIDFENTPVDFFFKHCELTNYSKSEILKDKFVFDVFERAAGFCTAQPGWQLCHGKIGFPLISDSGDLVGLVSLPVDCDHEGSTAAAIFDPVTIREIESYLDAGMEVLFVGNLINLSVFLAVLRSVF